MRYNVLFLLLLSINISVHTQTKLKEKYNATNNIVNKVANKENVEHNNLFQTMLSGTAKVLFVDSIVVDKQNFFSNVPISKEVGSFAMNNEQFTYTNELNNHQIFSAGDTINGYHLYTTYRLGSTWSKPKKLTEIDKETKDAQYPFLLSDGLTLFFSAKGNNSMGGYDIFMTLFNTEHGTYYKPENYGLPFNSTANDYMLAIDDVYNLGWLVTDRYQPKGKVCIYTFVPTTPRQNFTADNLNKKQLEKYAKLLSIKDTWNFGNRNTALLRLEKLLKKSKNIATQQLIFFPINNLIVYRSINDFKSEETKNNYKQLLKLKEKVKKNELELTELRQQYSKANITNKQKLHTNLLQKENNIQLQRLDIKNIEKYIRNKENKLLKTLQ